MRFVLPEVYRWVLGERVWGIEVRETAVECGVCVMARGPEPRYRAELKCCTYFPFIANFLAGEALSGVTVVSEVWSALAGEGSLLPLGIVASQTYKRRFAAAGPEAFGQMTHLLCPFYEAGRCGIWAQRGSECVRFHCRSSYGKAGFQFWREFGDYLHRVEASLAQWCLIEGGFTPREVEDQLKLMESGSVPEAQAEWHHWSNREREFFANCATWVRERGREWLRDSGLDLGEEAIQSWKDMLSPAHVEHRTPTTTGSDFRVRSDEELGGAV